VVRRAPSGHYACQVRLLVACHDAGGAEIVSSWLRHRRDDPPAACLLDGPARAIFARKLGPALRQVDELPPLDGFDLVLCGSSGEADLERRVVRAARAVGVRSVVWLDHWINYRQRFVLDGELVAPDEVWVSDERAARLAAEALPGARIRACGNPYLDDAAAEIRALDGERPPGEDGERILYLTQPTTSAARVATGDPLGFGYEECGALRGYLEHLADAAEQPAAVRVRPHPSESESKYAGVIAAFAERLPIAFSPDGTLAEDCAWADTVAGCDSMAMAVALAAGRRVVSVIPLGGREISLPFAGIERLYGG
jgi:hypothetical protein